MNNMSLFEGLIILVVLMTLTMILYKWENSVLVVVLLEATSVSLVTLFNFKGASAALLVILLVFLVGESLIMLAFLLSISLNSMTSYSTFTV